MLRRTVVLAAMTLPLAGCGFTESAACTQIAAQPGIAVTVEPGPARSLTKLALTVCSGSKCRTHQVKLAPGSDMVDQGCVGTDPDAACSATAVPNQTLVGFVEIAGMTEGPLRVSGTATYGRRTSPLRQASIVATMVHPNGAQCPGSAPQASVAVTATGLR